MASPPLTPPVREAPSEVFLLLFVHKKKTYSCRRRA
jgi:hypothetical protein